VALGTEPHSQNEGQSAKLLQGLVQYPVSSKKSFLTQTPPWHSSLAAQVSPVPLRVEPLVVPEVVPLVVPLVSPHTLSSGPPKQAALVSQKPLVQPWKFTGPLLQLHTTLGQASGDVQLCAPDVVPEVVPLVVPEVVPLVVPEVVPLVVPEVVPLVVPEVEPDVPPVLQSQSSSSAQPVTAKLKPRARTHVAHNKVRVREFMVWILQSRRCKKVVEGFCLGAGSSPAIRLALF
jgi:hypothetical protein